MKKTLWNDGWIFNSDICPEWEQITLPHDAMQTEKRIPLLKDGNQTGYYPGGLYTYKKDFYVEEDCVNDNFYLEFEGVYMKSSVYVNDVQVGGRIYGYSDFFVELTGKLHAGNNEIKVIADNTQCANSRWYTGSGIYRDVYLHHAKSEFVYPDGIKVDTIAIAPAKLSVKTKVRKEEQTECVITIYKDGKQITVAKGTEVLLDIPNAQLWSAETPNIYQVEAALIKDGIIVDKETVETGIRQISWDSKKGFQINGEEVKLRGGCVHHDHGILGASERDDACLRKVKIMKEAGFNAVRIAHHPASHAMLRSCDRLGMYVMNETFDTWHSMKSPYDYGMYFDQECEKDVKDMIRVSYNHPSVVMYSIGNEVGMKNLDRATETTNRLLGYIKKEDTTRPCTNGINPMMVMTADEEHLEERRNDIVNPREEGEGSGLTSSKLVNTLVDKMEIIMQLLGTEKQMRKHNSVFEPLDIAGFNYGSYLYTKQHKDYPERVLLGTETFPAKIFENWDLVKNHPYVIGDFLWTAWDYLGEAGCGDTAYGQKQPFTKPFPSVGATCGNIDRTGEIKCQGYYTSIVYGTYDKPYIAVHPVDHAGERAFFGTWSLTDAVHSWAWQGCEGKEALVDVYSNAAQVELFINGSSLGKKDVKKCMATYKVPYEYGELKAVHYDAKGRKCGSDIIYSASKEDIISIKPEQEMFYMGKKELIYVPIEITDSKGIRKMLSDKKITVQVKGEAKLIALGNGAAAQDSLTPFIQEYTDTFRGRALAILETSGNLGSVVIHVSTNDGLEAEERFEIA